MWAHCWQAARVPKVGNSAGRRRALPHLRRIRLAAAPRLPAGPRLLPLLPDCRPPTHQTPTHATHPSIHPFLRSWSPRPPAPSGPCAPHGRSSPPPPAPSPPPHLPPPPRPPAPPRAPPSPCMDSRGSMACVCARGNKGCLHQHVCPSQAPNNPFRLHYCLAANSRAFTNPRGWYGAIRSTRSHTTSGTLNAYPAHGHR